MGIPLALRLSKGLKSGMGGERPIPLPQRDICTTVIPAEAEIHPYAAPPIEGSRRLPNPKCDTTRLTGWGAGARLFSALPRR